MISTYVVAAALLFSTAESTAKFGKQGQGTLEGSFSFSFQDPYGIDGAGSIPETISLTLTPTILYFAVDNLAIGVGLNA